LKINVPIHRHKLWYALAIFAVIVIGLGSRHYPQLGKYPGDALWTIVVFLILGFALPRVSTLKVTVLALLISYAVEFGQLYRAPWLVAIRSTTLGHLLLGSDFGWGDLAAYTVGALIALVVETLIVSKFRSISN
jgi:glycopeptide antibiotics resistance protein